MDWKGKWIWLEGESESQNFWLCARKRFNIQGNIEEAKLHITADSRYVVWVNGQRIGQGPIRSWPFAYHYDTYDLSHRLRQGENVIAILGLHYGVGTFQYVPEPGGLLAQVELKDKGENVEYICTDESWRVMEHPSYDRRTPRISCQQAWVEHFDARSEPLGWRDVGFDDSTSSLPFAKVYSSTVIFFVATKSPA